MKTLLLSLAFYCVLVSSQIQLLAWNCANTPGGCNNACFSVFCQGGQSLLTRNNPPPLPDRGIKRRQSGCALQPCSVLLAPAGTVCDEFPFASSNEGGFGATLRCIPVAESQAQGGILSSFIQHQGVLVGGQYQLFVFNIAGSPYCNPGAGCLGDNNEFHIQYRLYRRRGLQNPLVVPQLFSNTTAKEAAQINPRRFVTQSNLQITLLSTSSTKDYISSLVYVGDGKSEEIVSEIQTGVVSAELRP